MPARTNTFTSFVNDVDSLRYPTDPGSVDTLIPPLSYGLQSRPPFNPKPLEPVEVENSPEHLVQLARRRASRSSKEKFSHRKATGYSRPQGRPLSKETTVRLTLVPTLGILYSLLVSDSMRKPLKVLKYSNEKCSVSVTDEELSTRNAVSGFSSLLDVRPVKFVDDANSSPKGHSKIPQFSSIDEAVYSLFGISEYSLIRVTRAAASEIGGSVLLKLETAMPGNLYLNDDEDEDFRSIQLNKEIYQETLGVLGQRPTTTFLKKKVARPRYKADMRIYLIPKAITCAIYCEPRIFKRDLLRGFLNMNTGERSIISAFDYGEFLQELKSEGNSELLRVNGLPSLGEVELNQKRSVQSTQQISQAPASEPLRGVYETLPNTKKTKTVTSYNSPQYEQHQVHQYPQATYTQESAAQPLYNHHHQQQLMGYNPQVGSMISSSYQTGVPPRQLEKTQIPPLFQYPGSQSSTLQPPGQYLVYSAPSGQDYSQLSYGLNRPPLPISGSSHQQIVGGQFLQQGFGYQVNRPHQYSTNEEQQYP